jgi:predicted RND superfamily exporter protein
VLAGIAALIISQSPTISDVGLLAVVALLTGLILNLLFLPLLLRWNKVSGIQSALAKARKSP